MNYSNHLSKLLVLLFIMHVYLATAGGKNDAEPYKNESSNVVQAPGDLSASITGATTFCTGTANGVITFEGFGGTAPYTFTYEIDGNLQPAVSSPGSSGIANVLVNTSTDKVLTYRITSVRGATGKTTVVDISAIITVIKSPVVDFSFTGTDCSDAPVQFTPTVQGIGSYTYLWDFGDGQTSTEQNPSHAFNSLGCGNAPFTVSLTVIDNNGCSTTRSKTVTVLQKPDISFNDLNYPFGDPFNNCGMASDASPNYTISVGNTSNSAGCINSYTIDWGDGTAPVFNAVFPATHTYATLGAFDMVITAAGSNNCTNFVTYVVKNLNNPSVGITSPGTTTNLCAPTAPLMFEIAKWGTNSPGTTYTVDYGDGTPIITFTQEELKASPYYVAANPSASANFPIPHSYTIPNCPNGPYMVRLVATNACSSTEATVNNITVFNKTMPDFSAPAHVCVNTNVVFINTSIPGYNPSCNQNSIYTWDFGDGSTLEVTSPTLPKNTNHTYNTPGQYTVKLTTKNICGESTKTQQITIDPPVTATVSGTGMVAGNITVCQNELMPVITFTGSNGTAPYTFTYRINNGPLQTITTAPSSSSVTIQVPTGSTGTFTYTLVNVVEGSPLACTQNQTASVTVVVAAPPSGTITATSDACLNGPSPSVTFTGSNGTRPYTFTYNINGGPVQTITTTASSNSVTVAVPTNATGTFKYDLIGVQGAGASACNRTLAASATVTINPPPAPMTLTDYEYCNGENTSVITFTNAVAGTSYQWSNSNPSIGLAGSGTGNIPSFKASNTTGAPITSTITVIPSVNGCDGPSQTFTITVYPPAVLFSPGDQTICSGDQTEEVILSSNTAGAGFSWTATSPAGITGVVTSGTNIIPVQTLVNTTSTPITITYTAVATLPATDPCAGTQYNYTIIVNPRPVVQETFSLSVCSASPFSVSPQNNSDNKIPSGTRYTWSAPVISPAGALTGGSAQAAPQASISQTLVNTTLAIATATYTVTPVANGCSGSPFTIVVSVVPLPTATLSGGATVCQNTAMPVITFTGANGTAPFTFTYRINSGALQSITTTSGNSKTLGAPTGNAGIFTYTLVSVQDATACSQSQSGTAIITIEPIPNATVTGDATVCQNSTSPVITFTGSNGTRPYTFTYNIDGGAVQSITTTAISNSVTLAVPTTAAGTYKYNLTGVQDASASACSRLLTASATVIVNDSPASMILADHEFCNGENTPVISFTNAVAGTSYTWSNSNTSIGLAGSGTGSIPAFTAINTTGAPVASTITVIPSVNGCSGVGQTFTITVHPSPKVTFSAASQSICSGENSTAVTLGSTTPGVAFSWTALQPAGITGVITSGTNVIPIQTLTNTTGSPIDVIYKAKATVAATNCEGSETTYTITVNPKPVVQQTYATDICSGSTFTVSPQNNSDNTIPSGTRYTWSAPVISPAGALTGGSAQAASQASISQTLVNTTLAVATATYQVTPTANGCAGEPFEITVNVFPASTATLSGDATVCQSAAMPVITFTGANGTAPFTFTYRINNGALQTITTTSGSSTTIEVPTDNIGTITCTLVSVQDATACSQSQSGTAVITIEPIPNATVTGDAAVCQNSASPVVTFTGSNGTRPYTFTYNIDGGVAQIISTTASSNSVAITVPTTATGTFNYNLTNVQDASVNSCSRTVSASATVTVNESPASMTLADHEFCNGEITSVINFANTVPGTTYQWSNSNPSIGLAGSGTGDIPVFTAINTTGAPVTSTITIMPSVNGCNGASQTFTITVHSPVITFVPGDQVICSGDPTTEVILSSNVAGAAFSWTATAPPGITGVVTSGTNTIPVQTLINTTGAPIAVTYTAKATLPGGITCSGIETSHTITVNPEPAVQETFNSGICSGGTFTVTPQDNTDNMIPSGTRYTWSTPLISPAGSITGASGEMIPQPVISQTLENTTSAVATATYQVTPIANGCAGVPFEMVVTVFPKPIVNPLNNLTLCHNEQTAGLVFLGNVSGTVYKWTSDNTAIGFSGSGIGNIPAFKAINTTNAPVTATISVTPFVENGSIICEGTPVQFTITVNPTGQVDRPADQSICSGKSLSIDFTTQNTGGATTYEWTNSNTAIGLSASGSGNISFVPVNTGSSTMSASITVTPVFSNNGVSCTGNAEAFTIDVDPTATVVKPLDQVVCNGNTSDEIRFTGNTQGATYHWTTDHASIGLPASGSGDILPFTAVNNGQEPIVATITVTPVISGCSDTPASFTITVNPTPAITAQPIGSAVCLGEKPALLSVTINGTGIPSYQWYSNTTASTLGGVLIPNATGGSYDPPSSVAGTFYYYCVITFPTNDCNRITSSVAEVTIHPNPVISAVDQEISSGDAFTVIPTWENGNIVPTGTMYVWSEPVVSPANAVSGASAQTVPQTEISQRLTNNTTETATVTYTVFPISGSCTGASFTVTVLVDSPLTPNVTVKPVTCFGGNDGSITTDIQGGSPFASGAPYTVVWTGPNGYTSTDASIFNLSPGVYHLTITDSRGKEFSASYILAAPEELMVVTDEQRDVACYGAATGLISISVTGGTGPYETIWTKDNAPYAITEDIAGLEAGTYVVTVTDVHHCVPKIIPYVISQPEPLNLTLKGKADIGCYGDTTGSISVEITGGVMMETAAGVFDYQYQWSGPGGFTSSAKDLSNLSAGDYQLVVTDKAGCTQSLAVILTEPSPLAVVAEITPISCYGANNATIRLDITGGTPPYQAEWDNYATGTYQDNLSAGDYTILITDANQCQITTTVNIPEAPVFRVSPEVKNVSCYGAKNGSIALNFESTLKSVILTWSDNSRSGTTRNNIGPGTYTVRIQGGDLCMINRTFIITEPLPLTITGTVTDITDCTKDVGGAIDLMVTGGTPPYRYAWSNGAVSEDLMNIQAGNYAITVTDSMGCAQVTQYTVKRPMALEIDVNTSIDYNCDTQDIKAICTARVTGGVTPYQLKWSAGSASGENNERMETQQSGIILLTVTDYSGCTASRSFSVEIPDPGMRSQQLDCNQHTFQFDGVPANESEENTYTWDFGDGTSSNLRNPQHTYSAAGSYKVRLTVAGANSCTSVYDDVVNVALPPVVAIDKDPRFCRGDSVLVFGTGAHTYQWNDGTTGDSIWIKAEGDYSVTGTSASGCSATYHFKASYYDLIGYFIQSDQQEVSMGANRIHLWSENIPFSSYQWDFGDGQSGQGAELFHSYEINDDGYFDVTLKVINPNGCVEETTKRIWRSVTTIANTFTPNSDGINDIYLKGWQIEVFNRNGILMYKGDKGWDGNHNGRPVDNDTYFVIIYDSTQLGAKYKTGYVTVLR